MTKLNLIVLGFLLGVLTIVGIRLAVVSQATDDYHSNIPQMTEGVYRIYHLQEMYDGLTGEPVYWVTAGRMTQKLMLDEEDPSLFIWIEPNYVRLWYINRSQVLLSGGTPPGDVEDIRDARLEINEGVARLFL